MFSRPNGFGTNPSKVIENCHAAAPTNLPQAKDRALSDGPFLTMFRYAIRLFLSSSAPKLILQ